MKTRYFPLILLLLLPLLLCGGVARAAEEENGKEVTKPAAPAAEREYVIGVDDVLSISAVGQDEVTQTVTVLADGTIRVRGIEESIKAEGMTLAQLTDRLFKGLDRLYANLQLSVSIKESNSRNVSIIGAVKSGTYPLRKGMRVSTLIAMAGGLPAKTKLVVGSLTRNFKLVKLDIGKILGQNPETEADLPLQPNDTVILDVTEEAPPPSFSVLGKVAKPGNFPLPLDGSPISVVRAIAAAGGPAENAALSRVVLQRKGEAVTLDLYPLLALGKADAPEGKVRLQDGDVLNVPEWEEKITVLGQVNRAGVYPIPEKKTLTVLDALAAAGGQTQTAEMTRVSLLRQVDGKAQVRQFDVQKMMTRKEELEKNVALLPGDVLIVPMRGRSRNVMDYFNPLFVLGALGLRPF